MNKQRLILVFIATCTLFVTSLNSVSYAAPSPGFDNNVLTLEPAVLNQDIAPGGTYNYLLSVIDKGTVSYKYTISVKPYGVLGENYTPVFTTLPGYTNVTSWFNIKNTIGALTAGETLKIPYSFRVPINISAGGYFAVVLVKVTPINLTGRSNLISIDEQLGEVLYLTVPGKVVQSGKIVSWQSGFLQKPPISAVLRLENTGRDFYNADISVNYSDIFNRTHYVANLNKVVLPNTIRRIPINWPNSPSYGIYKASGTVSYGSTHLILPARYVLVVSDKVRLITIIAVVCLLILFAWKKSINILRKGTTSKRGKLSK